LSGIRTDRLKWLAYCISAMLSAVAGVLYFAYFGSADPREMGQGYELNSIAAAVVGGCSLQGGIGTIPGTALGCLFLQVVIDGVGQVIGGGDADKYRGMIVGVVVAVAVTFNQLRSAVARRKQFFPGLLGNLAICDRSLTACHGKDKWADDDRCFCGAPHRDQTLSTGSGESHPH
jgi:ribose/xylose/arabinose/galactoside ABC-type transport system permease subunit